MSIHYFVRVFVACVLLLFNALCSLHADPPAKDWIRGTGTNLQICLRGEVLDSDSQVASDIVVSGGINASGVSRPLEPTIDGNRFELWIPVNEQRWYSMWLRATSDNGSLVQYKRLNMFEIRQAAIDGLILTLQKPTRLLNVKVTQQGEAVPNALVKTELGYGIELRERTGVDGIATFGLLATQKPSRFTAWTNDFRAGGFSFNRKPTRDPDADQHEVELSPCRDQKMRFVDQDGSPVPGITFVLQMATLPNYNFIGTNEHSRLTTDEDGEVMYKWFPDWDQHFFYPELQTGRWIREGDPEMVNGVAVMKLKKGADRKQVTGRTVVQDPNQNGRTVVQDPNQNSPAVVQDPNQNGRTVVQDPNQNSPAVLQDQTKANAGGFHVTLRSFQGERENQSDVLSAFSDTDGTFSLDVLPDATYCAWTLDSTWVGEVTHLIPYQSASDEVTMPELAVLRGQQVKVIATSGKNTKPYPNLGISFRREHRFTWKEDGRTRNGVGGPQWWATTDQDGIATTNALPGELTASVYTPLWRQEAKVDVSPAEPAIVRLHREVDEKRTLTGRLVLAGALKSSLEDAKIKIGSVDGDTDDQQEFVVKQDGSFSFETLSTEIGIFARTRDGRAAGAMVVKELDAPIVLQLQPTMDYRGQLLGNGDEPLVGHAVWASIRVEGESDYSTRAAFATSFEAQRIETKTDSQGLYTLSGLPSEMKVNIRCDAIDGSGQTKYLDEVYLQPGDSRPLAVSQLGEETSTAKTSLASRYEKTLRDCALLGFRMMIITSTDDESVTKFVDENFVDDDRNEDVSTFMQIVLAGSSSSLPSADVAFLNERKCPLPETGRVFACAIDARGAELGRLELDITEKGAADKASKFVHQHAPKKLDAEKKWSEAFEEAKSSQRKVWARISQRYCGPCFRMARWLDDNRELLAKDYVMLKIDNVRDEKGVPVARRLTRGGQHGVPFHAIFDDQQEILIDSEGPLGNIGHPSGFEGKQHLRAMLLETRQHLTDAEINQLVDSLGD